MSDAKNDQDQHSGSSAPQSPMGPMAIKPATLRNERANNVQSMDASAREFRLAPIGDHSQPSRRITELGHTIAPVGEVRPAMRLERSRSVRLTDVVVSPVEMRELRERRISAKELLPLVPGLRVRVR